MAKKKIVKRKQPKFKHEMRKISGYGELELIETVYHHPNGWYSAGPYYLYLSAFKYTGLPGRIRIFGTTTSDKPGSQAQLAAQFQSNAAFRAVKYLFSSDSITQRIVDASVVAAKQEMTRWKRSNTPFDQAQYILAVRRNTEARTKKLQSDSANKLY